MLVGNVTDDKAADLSRCVSRGNKRWTGDSESSGDGDACQRGADQRGAPQSVVFLCTGKVDTERGLAHSAKGSETLYPITMGVHPEAVSR